MGYGRIEYSFAVGKYSWSLSLKKDDFIKEWKSILGTVISGLKKCGYDVTEIKGMKQLIDQYKGVIGNGILYQK